MPYVPDPSIASAVVLICVAILCVSPILALAFALSVSRSLRRIAAALESERPCDTEADTGSWADYKRIKERHAGSISTSAFGR